MKQEKPDLRSVPEILEAVRDTYGQASDLIPFLSLSRHYAVKPHELSTIPFFSLGDGTRDEEAIRHEIDFRKWDLLDRADALRKHGEKIDQKVKAFEAAHKKTAELFEFAFADLGAFDDRNASVLRLIGLKYWDVKRWIRETIGFLSLAKDFPLPLTIERNEKIEALADGFPIDQAFLDAIGERLLIERSVLLKNAKAYAETKGITAIVITTPKRNTRTKSQEEDHKKRLLILTAYESWHKKELGKDPSKKRLGPGDWRSAWDQKGAISKSALDAFWQLKEQSGNKKKKPESVLAFLTQTLNTARKARKASQ